MAWARPAGAWAAAVEEEEAESGPIAVPTVQKDAFPSLGQTKKESSDFPSLGAAAAIKDTKKERRKKQAMSLADFQATADQAPQGRPGAFVPSARAGGALGGRRPMTDDELLLMLPTTSRGKVEGEEPAGPRLGGGFAGDSRGPRRYGDEEGRPSRRDEEDMGPSRADAADSWGAERKFVPSGPRSGFGGGFDSGRSRSPLGPSRADTTGDWGAERKFVPSAGGPPSSARGFSDRYEAAPVMEGPSRADAEDRWGRGGGFKPSGFEESRGRRGFGGGFRSRSGSREGTDNWRRSASPVAAAAAPKVEAPEAATKGASRASVFGTARPREEVLEEQRQRVADLQGRLDAGEGDELLEEGKTVSAALEEATKRLALLDVRPPPRGEESVAAGELEPASSKADEKSSWRRSSDEKEESSKPKVWTGGHFRDQKRASSPEGVPAPREGGRDRPSSFWGSAKRDEGRVASGW